MNNNDKFMKIVKTVALVDIVSTILTILVVVCLKKTIMKDMVAMFSLGVSIGLFFMFRNAIDGLMFKLLSNKLKQE